MLWVIRTVALPAGAEQFAWQCCRELIAGHNLHTVHKRYLMTLGLLHRTASVSGEVLRQRKERVSYESPKSWCNANETGFILNVERYQRLLETLRHK